MAREQKPGPYTPNLKTAERDAKRFDERMAAEKAATLARGAAIRSVATLVGRTKRR